MSVRLTLHVQPRAKENSIAGFDELGRLKVRVTSPPADGAANEALIELLAATLGVAKREVEIERGHGSRTKTVVVHGISADQAKESLRGR